jgi:hypothetical protein
MEQVIRIEMVTYFASIDVADEDVFNEICYPNIFLDTDHKVEVELRQILSYLHNQVLKSMTLHLGIQIMSICLISGLRPLLCQGCMGPFCHTPVSEAYCALIPRTYLVGGSGIIEWQ